MNDNDASSPQGEPQGAAQPATEPNAELTALQQERAQLEDQLRRTLADAANMRRRAQKEAEDARRRIVEGFAQELLPVVDNFELALQANAQAAAPDVDALVQGITMVRTMLLSVLERHGLQEIAALGRTFDPAQHEAVAVEPTAAAPEGQVVRVLMKGYLIGDRVVRHAKVVVAGPTPGGAGAQPKQ